MSYEVRVDEMIGKHLKHFQDEITLAKMMGGYTNTPPAMPYGYPIAVYRPLHTCQSPRVAEFVARTGGRLSNGVPRVLGMELVDQYALGLYNPTRACPTCKTEQCTTPRHRTGTRRPSLLGWIRSLQMSQLFAAQQSA